jgi:TPR repeat protein
MLKHFSKLFLVGFCLIPLQAQFATQQFPPATRVLSMGDPGNLGTHAMGHTAVPFFFGAMRNSTQAAMAAVVPFVSESVVFAEQLQDGITAYDRQDYVTALHLLQPLADQGSAAARVKLGEMYATGHGVPKDEMLAVKWYRKAADQNLAVAQYNLGVIYRNGLGVSQDDTVAVQWFLKAADQGLGYAQYNLGVMYQNGQGIPKGFGANSRLSGISVVLARSGERNPG